MEIQIAILGVLGTLMGTFLGWLLSYIQGNTYKADMYFICSIDYLPPCLLIYCRGEKPLILRKITITINGCELLGQKEFLNENIEFGSCNIVTIQPGNCKKINFTTDELVFGDGHYTNISSENEKQKLKICMTDLRGKKYKIKTKCTLEEYCTVINSMCR